MMVAHTIRGEGFDASEDGTGRGTPLIAFNPQAAGKQTTIGVNSDRANTVERNQVQAVAFAKNSRAELRLCGGDGKVSSQLTTSGGKPGQGKAAVASETTVRRLTPRECERLQGFPDDYTLIPYRGKPASKCPDGPRYKALGNSMATNCMRWIGMQIDAVDKAIKGQA